MEPVQAQSQKPCRRCGVTKPLEEFPPEPRNRDGRRADCRPCRNRFEAQRRDPAVEAEKARQRRHARLIERRGHVYAAQPPIVRTAMRDSERMWSRGPDPQLNDAYKADVAEAIDAGLNIQGKKWTPNRKPKSPDPNRKTAATAKRMTRENSLTADQFLAVHDPNYGDGAYFIPKKKKAP